MSLMYEDSAETNVQTLAHFQNAVALDPGFSAAHAAAARVLVNNLINGFTNVSMETIHPARAAALGYLDEVATTTECRDLANPPSG
jgi:hypothetical protein